MNDTAVGILAFLLGVIITMGVFAILQWTGTTSPFHKCVDAMTSGFNSGCNWVTSTHTKLIQGAFVVQISDSTDTLEKAQSWVLGEVEKRAPAGAAAGKSTTCKDSIVHLSYPLDNKTEKTFLWRFNDVKEIVDSVNSDSGWNTYTFSSTGAVPKINSS